MAAPLSVAEAQDRILDAVTATESETVAIADAAGRILAADLAARLTQPPFRTSTMDGYAVRADDVPALPARLAVIGEAAAGRGYPGAIAAGQCVRIFTGAPVPDGADAIVLQEHTSREGDQVIIREGGADRGFVRPRGKDFAEGDVLLSPGVRLDPRTLMLAAAMGHGELPVRRRPRVAILATGSELVLPGTLPGPDQIVCSNSYGIAAMVAAAGGEPQILGIARDTLPEIEAKLDLADGADVIVTSGGASEGDHDLIVPAMKARGMALDFWKIAMRPGKPLIFGHIRKTRLIGLPGNPVSALVCGRVFLVPLVRALLGLPPAGTGPDTAILGHDVEANGPRAHYMRARIDRRETPYVATVLAEQDSGLMSPLAGADALVIRAPHAAAAPAGSPVRFLSLEA